MIVKQLDGYFGNSVTAWRDEMMKRHRSLMARYARLERQGHPSTYGQGVMIEINEALIRSLERQYKRALAANTREMQEQAKSERP